MNFIFNNEIILENQRTKLEPLDTKHFGALMLIAAGNPELLKYSPATIGTEDAFKDYVTKAIAQRQKHIRYPFAIYDKLSGHYVGSTSYGAISDVDGRLEIGWTWIGAEFQRTGINKHCKFLLLQYAFDELGCERVEFKTDKRNVQSRNALEAIGAVYEGALRSHTLMPDGFRRDTAYYSILKSEWEKMRKNFLKSESKEKENELCQTIKM